MRKRRHGRVEWAKKLFEGAVKGFSRHLCPPPFISRLFPAPLPDIFPLSFEMLAREQQNKAQDPPID